MQTIYRDLAALLAEGKPCALATLVAASGSSPQNVGARLIVLPDGRLIGTIGGGCMEAEARRVALDCLRRGAPRLFDLRLDGDFGWDDGLICGGRVSIHIDPAPADSAAAYAAAAVAVERRERAALCVPVSGGPAALLGPTGEVVAGSPPAAPGLAEAASAALGTGKPTLADLAGAGAVYVEPIVPRPVLLIAGAGHVGAAIAQIAALCDFEVVVVDDRPSFADPRRLPFADRVLVDDIPRCVRSFPMDGATFVVIVTRGHRHDAQVLRECIHSGAAYIGMIGSRRKICVIYEEMLREGLATKEELRRVHSPLGLDIGSREVGEIAVSIVAELVAVRRGADLDAIRPLRYHPPLLGDGVPG